MPSSSSAARTLSPRGPVPCPPAYTTGRPCRAAAAMMLKPPPTWTADDSASMSPPRSGKAGTHISRSTIASPAKTSLLTGWLKEGWLTRAGFSC